MASISISATDGAGSFDAYLAEPKKRPAGAVVLIQEIFGINASMRDTAGQVAELGFFALAPDLFWRQERNVDITDKTQEEWNKAFALMKGFDHEKGIADLKATLAAARAAAGRERQGRHHGLLPGRHARLPHGDRIRRRRERFLLRRRPGQLHRRPGQGPCAAGRAHRRQGRILSRRRGVPRWWRPARAMRTSRAHVYPGADHAFARVGGIHWDARSAWIANGRSAEALAATLD